MSTLSDILSNLAMGGSGTPSSASAAVPQTPVAPNYVPQPAIAQQYNLANQLRRVAPATSWAGVLAHGLGAIGGNLVQGDADNALAANQALRKTDIANAANATDVPTLEKSLITAQSPDLQNLGLETKIKQITDDPNKAYRVRAAQAAQYGLQPQTPEYRDFVLTGKLPGMTGEGPYGKAGAIFQGQDGKYYSIQFGANGKKLVEPVAAGDVPLTPARGVTQVGDELVDKATGGFVRNVAPQIANAAGAKKTGELTAEGQMGLPKAKIALAQSNEQNSVVSQNIDKAISQADGWNTGFIGSLTSHVPGTKAFDLGNTLNTIKANLGFDKLQDMRNNSPTGGALGQVSEMENRLLQSVWGSLEQSQSKEQLVENLNKIKGIRQRFQQLKQQAYDQDVARFGAANVPTLDTGKLPGQTPGVPSEKLQGQAPSSDPLAQARDAIAKGADRNAVIQRLQQNGIDPSGL